VGVRGRELVEFSVIIVPLQLPDDNTECKVKNDCIPGYVSTHSNGKKSAAKPAFSRCCDISVLCLPSCEGSSISFQSPCSLTPKRTEREVRIFSSRGEQMGLDRVGWMLDRCMLW